MTDEAGIAQDTPEAQEEAKPRLNLEVEVQPTSACRRHIKVTVPREDIERYYDEVFTELVETAPVDGFRRGRAPRKLIEARYRKEVTDRVKGSLLMDAMGQATDEQKLAAISEPDIDPTIVELPDDGPLTFEFDLEVRPDFELPQWKGLTIERPVREVTEQDVDRSLQNLLAEHGRLVPKEGAAESGDYIVTKLTFKREDGQVLATSEEETIRLRPVLSFRDGKIEKFDDQMQGVREGEVRELNVELSEEAAASEAVGGQKVVGVFEVREVKQLKLPELNQEFLGRISSSIESVDELRMLMRASLQRQFEYQAQRRIREQITAALTAGAQWDLPPDLLRRQTQRELERAVLELRRSGFSDREIQAYENELRHNSLANTARALREHFILERIAEEEKIEDLPEDYDREIELIALQSGENPRRIRARLEKQGLMDALRNQIIERKVLELVQSHCQYKDVPWEPESRQVEAVDASVGGRTADESIPQAKYDQPSGTAPGTQPR